MIRCKCCDSMEDVKQWGEDTYCRECRDSIVEALEPDEEEETLEEWLCNKET